MSNECRYAEIDVSTGGPARAGGGRGTGARDWSAGMYMFSRHTSVGRWSRVPNLCICYILECI